MPNLARAFATAALLALTQQGWAQAWLPEPTTEPGAETPVPLTAWPKLNEDIVQTWVGIRHNKTDGTVVGVGLRSAAYPSFLLQLEVVPPGYGPVESDTQSAPPPLPADSPKLRNFHKLSLRYRF